MRPGKALRDQWLVNQLGNTPAAIAARAAHSRAVAKLEVERAARYPTITAENFAEACAWQERRLQELLAC